MQIQLKKHHGRYSKYKQTGIPWLGEVPEEWTVEKLKFRAFCWDNIRVPLNADERGKMVGDIPYYGANGIVDYVNDYLFDKEIVLLGEDGAPFLEPDKPVAFKVKGKCWVNNHAHILEANKKNQNGYLMYSLNAVDYALWIDGSTRQKLTKGDMFQIPLAAPDKHEQQMMANYLDKKSDLIEKIIESKQKQIEFLKEKRSSLINRAVTRGVAENVEMKDSGVEWIDFVPQDWQTIKMQHLTKYCYAAIKTGPFGSDLKGSDMSEDGEFRVYNQRNVLDENFDEPANYITKEKFHELKACEIFDGDILITTRGTIGKTAIFPKGKTKGILHPCLIRIRVNEKKCSKDFLRLVLENAKYVSEQFYIISNATTIEVIYSGTLKNTKIILPPLPEQEKIIVFLDSEIQKIDKAVALIERSISFLEEYKTSLISHVVTGKIKVTNS